MSPTQLEPVRPLPEEQVRLAEAARQRVRDAWLLLGVAGDLERDDRWPERTEILVDLVMASACEALELLDRLMQALADDARSRVE